MPNDPDHPATLETRTDALDMALYDYELPSELIAQRPLERGASRLLHVPATGPLRHLGFRDLPQLLQPGDLLVTNNTRVIPARLHGYKQRTEAEERSAAGAPPARVEVLLTEPLEGNLWRALLRPGRRFRGGGRISFHAEQDVSMPGSAPLAIAEVLAPNDEDRDDGSFRLRWSRPIEPLLEQLGEVPLPHYIERSADERDRSDYQTVFASRPGAVAAPTAGRHFDEQLLEQLVARGIERVEVTLHVGPGTFRPVTAARADQHVMHSERYEVPPQTVAAIERTRRAGGRVVAVGTTVVRTLEAAAAAAPGDGSLLEAGSGATDLFLKPGDSFRVVDLLLTNFHLPRSTLMLLVSAFAGRERVLHAYREAVAERYRFFSYGDAMLLEPPEPTLSILTARAAAP